jgi:hypothetical protein
MYYFCGNAACQTQRQPQPSSLNASLSFANGTYTVRAHGEPNSDIEAILRADPSIVMQLEPLINFRCIELRVVAHTDPDGNASQEIPEFVLRQLAPLVGITSIEFYQLAGGNQANGCSGHRVGKPFVLATPAMLPGAVTFTQALAQALQS